jgi:hypothetical protein
VDLFSINGEKQTKFNEVMFDFNLRNLSLSILVSGNLVQGSKLAGIKQDDIAAEKGRFRNPDLIELQLRVLRSQVGIEKVDKVVESFPSMAHVLLVVSEKPDFFMSKIYPIFKDKKPIVDNNTDLESLASFCTVNAPIY